MGLLKAADEPLRSGMSFIQRFVGLFMYSDSFYMHNDKQKMEIVIFMFTFAYN